MKRYSCIKVHTDSRRRRLKEVRCDLRENGRSKDVERDTPGGRANAVLFHYPEVVEGVESSSTSVSNGVRTSLARVHHVPRVGVD